MAVLNALRRTPGAIGRNPILLVPVAVLMLTQLPPLLLQYVNPLLSSIVSMLLSLVFIVVIPFFQGGTIAMADEAIDGRTTLQTFMDAGKSNYLSILGAYLVLFAVYFVLGIIGFIFIVGGLAAVVGAGGLESASLVVLAVIGVLVAVSILIYLVAVFFLQFYGQAIVLDDESAIGGFKRSASVVRNHLISTLGYTVLCMVFGGLLGGVFAVASFVLSPQPASFAALPDPSMTVVAIAALVMFVLGTAFGAFFLVFSVSFYRTVTA